MFSHFSIADENNSTIIVDRDNVSRSEPEIAGLSNAVELPPPNNSPSTLSGVERNNNFSPPRNHTCIQCQQQVNIILQYIRIFNKTYLFGY